MLNLPGVQPEKHRDDLGRPTLYRPEYDAQAMKLCELGATDADLAEFFDVSERTINEWRVRNESFAVASRVGKLHADERVKVSFFKIANGYEYDEEFITKDGRKETKRVVVPPNPTAIVKWLSARTPEFREKQLIEHSGEVKQGLDITKLSPVQLAAYEQFLEVMRNGQSSEPDEGKG